MRMKNLPLNLILEKNKLATPNPWLTTLDVIFPAPASPLYLVNNTEDIVFGGRTYQRFPFTLDAMNQDANGEIPTLQLRISNVLRILQAYIEEQDGCVGATVLVRVINAAYLGENYAELEMTFDVLEAGSDANWVTFTLGAPNPLRANFPLFTYRAGYCNWVKNFKGAECTYAGAATSCDGTIDTCRNLGNSRRFGGSQGLAGGGVRLV